MFNSYRYYKNFSAIGIASMGQTRLFGMATYGKKSKLYFQLLLLTEEYNSKTYFPILSIVRSFAKSKKIPVNFPVDDRELSQVFNVEALYSDFRRPLDRLKNLFIEQLSVRSSSNAIHQLKVKFDGKTYMVQDLAEIGSKSSKEVILNMGAFIGAIPNVMNALRESPMKLNPTQSNTSIIVPIAKVTREHRENLAKGAKKLFNNCREDITDVQNKYIKKTDNIPKLPKDQYFRLKAQLTALGKKHIAEAEDMLHAKEKELLLSDN